MTAYGFRLFEASLYSRTSRKPRLQYFDKSGRSYINHLSTILGSHINEVHRGVPHDSSKFEETEDLETNDDYRRLPLFRLLSYKKISDYALLLEVEHGRRSGHSNAMADPSDVEAEDVNIANHYPARTFRAVILAPPTGTAGILAMESISLACPAPTLVKWLSHWSEAYGSTHADQESSETLVGSWWTLKIQALTDEETQERYISSGIINEIRVAKHSVSADRKRPKLEYSLKSQLVSTDQRVSIGGVVRGWFSKNKVGEHTDDSRAAKEVAAIISKDFSEADFTDVELSMTDPETKQRKTMKPNDFAEVFVYPVCEDVPPEPKTLLTGIRSRVQKISKSAKTTLDWTGFPSSLNEER